MSARDITKIIDRLHEEPPKKTWKNAFSRNFKPLYIFFEKWYPPIIKIKNVHPKSIFQMHYLANPREFYKKS